METEGGVCVGRTHLLLLPSSSDMLITHTFGGEALFLFQTKTPATFGRSLRLGQYGLVTYVR